MDEKVIHLTSSEIGALWTEYMNESMSKYILKFMLTYIQDSEIKPVIQQAYDFSASHLDKLHDIFESENYAIPNGFTEQDVNMDAPWLFTDLFSLTFVNHMARIGMLTYAGFVAVSYREDIYDYFSMGLNEVNNLYKQSLLTAQRKGVNARHPFIEVPKKTDEIDSKKYLSGLNPFHDKRPLNAIEISHLYLNVMTNFLGAKLSIAFAQTSPLNEVQDYMLRCKNISQKHAKVFGETLSKDDILSPHVPDVGVSDSTAPTFSDKLMMFLMSVLMTTGIGNYATAAAASQRSDLMLQYERLSVDVARLAKSGADIMIKHGWLEQPPASKDVTKLAKEKKG